MIEITPENARRYLVERGIIAAGDDPRIEALGWGVSNVVMRVQSDGRCFVFKQSLPRLRVQDDWRIDRRRIFVERDAMALFGEILPPGSVPAVEFSDEENFVLGMSCAPPDGRLWKEDLMAGQIDLAAARRAGILLARMHNRAAGREGVRERFGDPAIFIQGRVDPYHHTAARAHPDLAPVIHAEVERMLRTRRTLVHGDFSPKNIFVYPDHLLLLDFEIAHFGDPAFDAGFLLTHLLLKTVRFPERAPRYLAAAREFWRAYAANLESAVAVEIDRTTVRELGCLLLARIDGKSKAEYITEEPMRNVARQLARYILLEEPRSVLSLLATVEDRVTSRIVPQNPDQVGPAPRGRPRSSNPRREAGHGGTGPTRFKQRPEEGV
jgi:5-methylthioribose kinase